MDGFAAHVVLLWGWRRALAALLAGAVVALAMPPYDFFPAAIMGLTLLVWLLDGAVPERSGFLSAALPAFATGWFFGFGYFLAGLWWIGNALLVDAENHAWALPFAVAGLPAVLALFYGLAALLARIFWSDGIGRIAALAFGFGVAEWLRSFVLSGFPWNAIGQAAMPIPLLMQSLGIAGFAGMNALAVFVLAMPALLSDRRHLRLGTAAALTLALAHVAYGAWALAREVETERVAEIRIVQPAIDQSGKWDPQQREAILARLVELSALPWEGERQGGRTVIWPETSVPYLISERPEVLVSLASVLSAGDRALVGAVRTETGVDPGSGRYYNSLVAINDDGQIYDAGDKVHLVPFGEYLPFPRLFDMLGMGTIANTMGGFSAAGQRRPLEMAGGAMAIPLVCYEVIFPGYASLDMPADLIVNITNDAWFGDTAGPYQHLRQAQLRAVESGLPLVRAANDGISAVISARGQVLDALAKGGTGVLDHAVALPPSPIVNGPLTQLNGMLIILFFATMACGTAFTAKLRFRRPG